MTEEKDQLEPRIVPCHRLAKRKRVKIEFPRSGGDNWKTRDMWLAENLGMEYSRRHGYSMPEKSAELFLLWRQHDVRGRPRIMSNDRDRKNFSIGGGSAYLTRGEMTKHVNKLIAAQAVLQQLER